MDHEEADRNAYEKFVKPAQNADYVCWCDGDIGCPGRAKREYGLCRDCLLAGHNALPPLPFSLDEEAHNDSSGT